MNCNIFRVQLANNFHIFLHIRQCLLWKPCYEIHIDDRKAHTAAAGKHGKYILNPVPPPQKIQEMLLHRLWIDTDTVDTIPAQQCQYVFARRIRPSRFNGPFLNIPEIPGYSPEDRLLSVKRQTGRCPPANIYRTDLYIILPA